MPSFRYTVTPEEDFLRADKWIKRKFAEIGYVFLQKLFRLRKIKANGVGIPASARLHAGDILEIFANLAEIIETSPVFEEKKFDYLKSMIIHENKNFLAINKPAGLPVQSGTKVSTCVETFINSYPDVKCHLVHRLDKDTSGVLLIAKNLEFARQLTKLFRENKIEKTYLAVVDGKICESGTIDNFLEKSLKGNEERIGISSSGKRAVTRYGTLKLMGNYTLLELNPLTGRKHQLRVHCAEALGAPILGDRKYNNNLQHKELFLHAHKIFIKDLKIEITAEIPEYFREIISGE
ncbi:MAG: RluA family pseudouridine synthase [Holosporaceae bacterium]|jgi:23S rRNA pseudouridine955/2504/2580 synthase|nr:RluA family pseudouridine synthase [Holosporaceae bacterium]